jgi:hypothetical protein
VEALAFVERGRLKIYSNCVPSFKRFNGFAITRGTARERHTLKCYLLCIITDYYEDEKIIKNFSMVSPRRKAYVVEIFFA